MALGQVNVPGAAGMDAVEAKQAAQAAKEAAEAAQRTAESSTNSMARERACQMNWNTVRWREPVGVLLAMHALSLSTQIRTPVRWGQMLKQTEQDSLPSKPRGLRLFMRKRTKPGGLWHLMWVHIL